MDGIAPALFRIGTLGFVKDTQDRVLLVRVTYGRRGWQLPGGFLEIGESPEQALVREFREELGVAVDVGSLMGIYYKSFELNLALVFECKVSSQPFALASDEVSDFGYFAIEDLPDGVSSRTTAVLRIASCSDQPFILTFDAPE